MSNFETLKKDLGATARRIISNVKVFTTLSTTDQVKLHDKLVNWSPKTAEAIHWKGSAIEAISATENFFVPAETATIVDTVDESPVIIPTAPEVESTPAASEFFSPVSRSVAEKIARETFIFEFHFSQPTFMKKIDSPEFLHRNGNNGGIDSSRLRVSKYTLGRESLKELHSHGRNFVRFLRDISLPGGLLTPGGGQYLVPLSHLELLKDTLSTFLEERQEVLQRFIESYPSFIEASREELGSEFDSRDYPHQGDIQGLFTTSFKYISNTVPEEFARVSKELMETEQARIFAICQAEGGRIQGFLRENFSGLVDHFVDILSTDEESGKPKTFKKGSVDKLKEFIRTFKDVNLTEDGDLSVLVAQTEELLDGVDPQKIRSSDELRESLNNSFAALKESAAKLVVTRVRKIEL